MSETFDRNNILIYLNGKDKPAFRCDCGCNVFHNYDDNPNHFACNSCNTKYIGE